MLPELHRRMPSANAEALLVILMRKHLGVTVERTKLRAFLRDHFDKVSPLAHAIHEAPDEPPRGFTSVYQLRAEERTKTEQPEHESWPYEFVERPAETEGQRRLRRLDEAMADARDRARAHLASVKPQDASRGFTTDQERGDD